MKTLFNLLKKFFCFVLIVIIVLISIFIIVNIFVRPSNDRDWNLDQVKLPTAEINDNLVVIKNIRNFSYKSTTEYTPSYYDKTYDLNKLKKVWYMVEPLSMIPGSAHTLVSFEFEGNEFVSISVEIRKEKGESYDPIKGLLNNYELMYVIADERDVIKLRSNYRKDLVYLYPMNATKEKAQELFLNMVKRANDLSKNPEFYNTLTSTCTTNIVDHVNKITPNKVPFFSFRILLPANSDKLAYELGLIDTTLPFEEIRSKYFINDKAMKYADDVDFSVKIRRDE